jgi:hypothetical protein
MAAAFTDADWNVMRAYIYNLLLAADGRGTLSTDSAVPSTIDDMRSLVKAQRFEMRLDETLQMTTDALKDASGALTQAHRVAAAVQVNAPTVARAAELEGDLRALGRFVQRDRRAKALSSFFASAAEAIRGITAT